MTIDVKLFALKRQGYDASLLVHTEQGNVIEMRMGYDELKELMMLSAIALDEVEREMHADYKAECESLNKAEDDAIRQRETALEMDFSRHGYDDIPF
jgi:hypothetical protein